MLKQAMVQSGVILKLTLFQKALSAETIAKTSYVLHTPRVNTQEFHA